jgi:hypothetical protein
VWNSQHAPSARSVARALTQAGRVVHFTTVARWKRRELLTIASFRHPLVGVQDPQVAETAEVEADPETPFSELPAPVTPQEAKHVWERQGRPSSRNVARVLTQAGRPVHFTTVARWKRRGWRANANLKQHAHRSETERRGNDRNSGHGVVRRVGRAARRTARAVNARSGSDSRL